MLITRSRITPFVPVPNVGYVRFFFRAKRRRRARNQIEIDCGGWQLRRVVHRQRGLEFGICRARLTEFFFDRVNVELIVLERRPPNCSPPARRQIALPGIALELNR